MIRIFVIKMFFFVLNCYYKVWGFIMVDIFCFSFGNGVLKCEFNNL